MEHQGEYCCKKNITWSYPSRLGFDSSQVWYNEIEDTGRPSHPDFDVPFHEEHVLRSPWNPLVDVAMSFQEVVKVPQELEDTVQPVHVLTVTFPFSCLVAGVWVIQGSNASPPGH